MEINLMITGNFFAAYEALGYTFTDPDGDAIFAQTVAPASLGGSQQIAETGTAIVLPNAAADSAFTVFPNGDFTFEPGGTAALYNQGTTVTLYAWIGISDRKDASGNANTAQDGPRRAIEFTVSGTKLPNTDPVVTEPEGAPRPSFSAD